MHRTTIHIASFGEVYSFPQQRDIFGSVFVRIHNINFAFVVDTLKHLVFPLSDMETRRASLRSVARFYGNQCNAIQSSLVGKKRTQLTKRPTTKFCPKLFVSPFGSKADIRQILNGNALTLFFSRIYNAFRNSVIDYSSRCSFPARKPFQQLTRVACAFALNRTANLLSLLPIEINPIGRVFNSIRCNDQICQTEVNSYKIFDVINILFGNINSLKEIEFTFFVNQISFAFNVGQISRIMANKVNFLSTTDTPQGNDIVGFIGHNASVISNTPKWSKSAFSFLIKFVSIGNFCNRANKHLRGKFESSLIGVVNFVMEFEIVKYLFRPSNFRNSITNCICFTDGFQKQISLFSRRNKFDFQSQFHIVKIQLFSDIRKYIRIIINKRRNLGQFLPLPKGEGVSLLPIL